MGRARPRPRIVHWMPWPVGIGGGPRLMHNWCRQNADRWEIHVVTAGTVGPWDWSGMTTWPNTHEAAALINDLDPDLVVNHFPEDRGTASIAAPQVWIMHGTPFLRKPPPWPTVRPVAVFSNFDSDEIHPAWREFDWRVLPIGVDLEAFRPRAKSRQPRRRDLVLGVVGRLHPEKFPWEPASRWATTLSRALHAWDRGRWRIEFIGQGQRLEWQDRFRTDLAGLDWVTFRPDVDPSEMPGIYHRLDALLVPTPKHTGETACYSAVEALACGVPVVSTDLPGVRASCRDVPIYGTTPEELLAAVRRLDDPAERRRRGQAGRRLAEEIHDLGAHVQAHSVAFASALPVEVSILTAVRDTRPQHLAEYWDGIRSQTYRRWELVLVDDGSADPATLALIEEIARDPRVRRLRLTQNVGGAIARNIGLKECRSDLVAIMDSDDVALPNWLARQVPWLQSHPEVTVAGCQIEIFHDVTRKIMTTTHHDGIVTPSLVDKLRTTGVWFVNHPGSVYRRQPAIAAGGYGPYLFCHDLSLWLRLLSAGETIVNTPDVLVRYRHHRGQLSQAWRDNDRQRQADYTRVLEESFHASYSRSAPPFEGSEPIRGYAK